MATFLFNEIIFGPVRSRRLGVSLGINLLPANRKVCSFDCIYCECGFNDDNNTSSSGLPNREEVHKLLETRLREMSEKESLPDVITFAGNGEPTLHPHFPEIINDTLTLRNIYCPQARVAVLSNASRIHSQSVFDALVKVDDNIQKLDSANPETIRIIDQPQGSFNLDKTVQFLKAFKGKTVIQTLFVKGTWKGNIIDNSTDQEVSAWLKLIETIAPREVMVYTIDRDTPVSTLEKVNPDRLNQIAHQVRELGIQVSVST